VKLLNVRLTDYIRLNRLCKQTNAGWGNYTATMPGTKKTGSVMTPSKKHIRFGSETLFLGPPSHGHGADQARAEEYEGGRLGYGRHSY
jgi:hypothetical protein